MRVLIRFIISLCFLLWGSYSHAHQQRLYDLHQQHIERPVQASSCGEHDGRVRISKNYPSDNSSTGDFPEAKEIEEEDEESESFKKRSSGGHGSISFLDGLTAGNCLPYLNAPLPLCEHFSYHSSNKFILHRVIRI